MDWIKYVPNNHQVHCSRASCDLWCFEDVLLLDRKQDVSSGNSSCFIAPILSPHLCSTQYMDGSLSCAGGRLWKYDPLKVMTPLSCFVHVWGCCCLTCFVESSWSAHGDANSDDQQIMTLFFSEWFRFLLFTRRAQRVQMWILEKLQSVAPVSVKSSESMILARSLLGFEKGTNHSPQILSSNWAMNKCRLFGFYIGDDTLYIMGSLIATHGHALKPGELI